MIMMSAMRLRLILLAALALASAPALAQNVVLGEAYYDAFCSSCHGSPPSGGPTTVQGDPMVISNAINFRQPAMAFLRGMLSNSQINDIAAYLGSLSGIPPPPPAPPTQPPPPVEIVPTLNYTDMWWNAAESGWGLNVIQHASNKIFAVMFTYDAQRKRTWFIFSEGTWTTPTTYTGSWYRVNGSPFNAPYRAGNVTRVGSATLEFSGASNATLTFSVDGTVVFKSMTRLPF